MGKTSTFSGLLDRATSQLQLEPDWASILQICDCIRQQDVTAKFAVSAIKRKAFEKNPHVSKFALIVLEACMKNCGSTFHDEIGTKEFMEEMRNIIRQGQEPVKDKALELIQTWAHVFRNETKYKIISDTYNLMKMEGCQFPAFKESEAMFSADCAPAWAEGDVCHMCRVKFGTFIRQHHCRKCGQVFCKKCSSKESIIPQFGIEREVRVCDPCYFQLNPQSKSDKADKTEKTSPSDGDLPAEYLNSALSKEAQLPPKRDPQQIKEQEEEELQLAMALSLSQEEAQKETKPLARSWPSNGSSNAPSTSNSRLYSPSTYEENPDTADMDPDLARYLNRSYWEGRKEQQSTGGYTPPSAPEPPVNDTQAPYNNHIEQPEEQINEADQSSDTLVNNFHTSLETLSERMQTISGKGRHIAMDATVQSLFQTVSAMHPQLLRLIEQQEGETEKYEALKERLGLVKDARVTLDDAREQHREKVRQQELEQDMLRRMQIEQKLELMRQQKAEYIAYQQRLQVERQMAMEQQQHQQQLRLQKYGPQSFPGQPFAGQYAVTDGSSPYSSMGYMPPASLPPPNVTQTDGGSYSSLNYIPPSSMGLPSTAGVSSTPASIQGPTAPGGMTNQQLPYNQTVGAPSSTSIQGPTAPGVMTSQQPPYNQPVPQGYQGYPGMENPAMMENQARSQSPRMGQPPPSYQQVDYSQYKPDMTSSMVNGQQQVPDYLQAQEQVPGGNYSLPGQQSYVTSSYPSQAPSQPPQYAQATSQQVPPHFDASQQGYPQQGNQPQASYGSQQPQSIPSQYAPQQQQGQQPDPTGFGPAPPHMQQQQQQQQQPLPLQQQLPQHHQLPNQQALPPQQQQQPMPQQHQPQQQQQQMPQQHQPQQQQQPQQQLPPLQQQQPQAYQPSPSHHQQPLPQQQQIPQQQQQQQQIPQHQQQIPQHQPPPPHQQMYEPQSQQYQTGTPYSNPQQYQQPTVSQQQQPNQYYQQQPSGLPLSGPPPQRQLSDLELISFD